MCGTKGNFTFFCVLIWMFAYLIFADTWQDTSTSDFSTGGLTNNTNVTNDSVQLSVKNGWLDTSSGWWNPGWPVSDWWDTNWLYRRAITINNTGASALSDYQIKVTNPVYNESGLAGSWHLEEGTGTTVSDYSGYCNNGTVTIGGSGSQTSVAQAWSNGAGSRFGGAVNFDGIDDYINVPDATSLNITSAITLEAWVKTTANDVSIFSKTVSSNPWNGYSLAIGANGGTGKISYWPGNFSTYSWQYGNSTSVSDGNWHHIAVIHSGTTVTFYLDGQFDGSSTCGARNTNSGNPMRIGRETDNTRAFSGLIDEPRIYNRALSSPEITAHYEAKVKMNYGDVRFINSAGTELQHWMEKDGIFWVNVTGSNSIPVGTSSILMYYGNVGASSTVSGNSTFEFFDDFNDGLDVNKWGVSGGAGSTVSNGMLNTLGSAEGMFYSKWYPTSGSGIFEFKIAGTGYTAFSWVLGQQGGYTANCILDIPLLMNSSYYYSSGWTGGIGHSSSTLAIGDVFKTTYTAGSPSWSVYKNDALQYNATQSVNCPSLGVGFRTYSTNEYEIIDWLFVRKYAAVEPTTSTASEMVQDYQWLYRREISVNNAGSALSDFQIKVENPVWNETGLTGSWHFEETPGTVTGVVTDTSGFHNDGTLTNFTAANGVTSSGKYGNAVSFDGVNDYILTNLDVQPSAMASTTWEAWVYPTRVNYSGGRQQIMTDDDGGYDRAVLIETNTSNFGVFTGSGCWQAAPADVNLWQHIAVVYTSTNVLFYKNGTQYSYGAPSGQSSGNKFSIGWNQAVGEYFQGMIDEVRVYKRALPSKEIISHYNAKAKLNYHDVRFVGSAGASIPYWMEKDGTFWLKITGSGSIPAGLSKIYAYYGNANASYEGNGTAVFEFFDDFDDGNLTGWTVDSGAWTAVNKYAEGTNSANNFMKATGVTPPSDYIAEYYSYAGAGMDGGIAFRYQDSNNTYATINRNVDNDVCIFLKSAGSWTLKSNTPFSMVNNLWLKNKFTMAGNTFTSTAAYEQNGTAVTATNAWTDPAPAWTNGSFGLYNYTTSDGRIDSVFVRKYAAEEPAVYCGYEVSQSSQWTLRKPVTLTNGGAQAISDYELKIENPVYDETGIIGAWHFEEGSGTIAGNTADTGGQGKTGTLNNFASPNGIVSNGKCGNALSFDGTNDTVTIGSLGSFPAQGTIEFWMKTSEVVNYRNVLTTKYNGGNSGIRFEEDTAGTFRVVTGNDGGTCDYRDFFSSPIQTGTWYHIVYSWNTSINSETGYLNGTQVFNGSHNLWPTTIPDLRLGLGFSNSAERYWKGLLDEVRIYSRELLGPEVTDRYQATKAKLNYGDIRFTNDSGIQLPYWMEKDGTFWVKVLGQDSIPVGQSDIYLYYANSDAVDESRPEYLTFASGSLISGGKTYTKTPSPSGSYPDNGNTQLTNGLTREDLYTGTEATVGWQDTDFSVRIDLGNTYQVNTYKGYFGGGGAGAIRFPSQINVKISTNDVDWTTAASGSGYAETEQWATLTSSPVTARYVKFEVTRYTPIVWTMAGEFEVYQASSQPSPPSVSYGTEESIYNASGTFTSAVRDTGGNDTIIDSVAWTTTGTGTIDMQVRAGNTYSGWTDVSPAWENVDANPDAAIISKGRYIQYKAAFTGSGTSEEPVLADVTVTYTVPITPPADSVLCDKLANTWYSTADFTFTSNTGFGASISKYYYVWDNNADYPSWTGTENTWTSSTRQITASSDGTWYFHYLPYSSTDTPGTAQDIGPFKYDGTAPSAPVLSVPAGNAYISSSATSFTWQTVTDASGITYSLVLDHYSSFDSPVLNKLNLSAATYTLSGTGDEILIGNSTYYWRVTAVDGAGNSTNSSYRKFTTSSSLPQVYNESSGEAYATLQDALDDALDGDSLTVNDTLSYNENITITSDITLANAVLSPTAGFAVTGQGANGGEVLRNCVITSGGISGLALGENLTLYNPDPTATLVIQNSHLINCLIELGADITNSTLENCDFVVTADYFVNAAAGDFHPATTAVTAIDKGQNLSSEFTVDKDGITRGVDVLDIDNFDSGCWDIGAYEFVLSSGYISNDGGENETTAYAVIVSDPGALAFYSTGSSTLLSDEFTILNAGTLEFNWTLSDDMEWLSLDTLSGSSTINAVITASVDTAGLSDGIYSGDITVTAAEAENNPLFIPVTLAISSDEAGYAVIYAQPSGFSFTAAYGSNETVTGNLAISGNAGADFGWWLADDAGWITASPTIGTSQDTTEVIVTIDASTLVPGTYSAEITVTAPDTVNGPLYIPVSLTITESSSTGNSSNGNNSTDGGNTPTGNSSGISLPGKPLPQSPSNGMMDVFPAPVLGWEGTGSADTTYWLQLSENAGFTHLLLSKMINTTIYQTTGVEYGKTYYWRVKSLNTAGMSDWSETYTFRMKSGGEDAKDSGKVSGCFIKKLFMR